MALTPRSFDVLRAMASEDFPLTTREIAEKVGLASPATVQAHIKRLTGLGLVETRGRRRRVTELGWAALDGRLVA
jgi:DNA-binding IclR family transcriptional regulator